MDLKEYISSNGCINFDKIEKKFNLVKAMQNCPQSPKYHKEGDVWEHTKLCLESLQKINEFCQLDEEEKNILFLAALLHDIGKPQTTKEDEEQITSKKHCIIGARMVREILWGLNSFINAPWKIREAVSNLVLLHMLPVYFVEKQDPLYSICGSSQVIKNKWLHILSLADSMGRICESESDRKTSLDTIGFFAEFCKENECYDRQKKFLSKYGRFRYFFEHKGHPDYDRYEPINGTVIMMSGLQAAGKNYIIDQNYKGASLVGLDETREDLGVSFGEDEGEVMRSTKEQCRVLMRDKKNFVFNATNTVKDIRGKWIRLFRQYGYEIRIHYVERPLKTILADNKKRNREVAVPESVILEKFAKLDIPTLLECHDLVLTVVDTVSKTQGEV